MRTCQVHGTHRPTPMRVVDHHVQPQAMGGPDAPANRVQVCDTGHYNIHRLLDDLILGGPMRRGGTAEERRLAKEGYDKWVRAGKPGKAVFQAHFHGLHE
jgi:anaerobic selenocysteine-containing dehydrogenase